MPTCTEFAVFEVKRANLARIIALSEALFMEINKSNKNIIAHEILIKTDNLAKDTEEVCWHLTWENMAAVEISKTKWSTYSTSAEIEALVGKKLYYGHFVATVSAETVAIGSSLDL